MGRPLPTLETSKVMQRVLDTIEHFGPLTLDEIAVQCKIKKANLAGGRYLSTLHKVYKLIHISGWTQNTRGAASAIYAYGPGEDAKRVGRRSLVESNSSGLQSIVEALEKFGPMTGKEVSQFAAVSYSTIKGKGYMQILKHQGRVHTSGWKRQRSSNMAPVYSAGPGEDVPRPIPYSQLEKLTRYREQKRLKHNSQVGLFVRQVMSKPIIRTVGTAQSFS